ncbi:ABC transporter permease [Bacillus sp. P1(2020)]|uniref:Transport permease protein n=1 Tax=Pallidibacillus pasinlerensis TaxID=2703818 RepID=A0ABX0A4R7_9BACI|nr:ABC transporter permease [Pallidibacillus pasinlerensis]
MKKFCSIRFQSIIKKEFMQIKKDPASLAIALILPVMLVLLLGYAMNTDIKNINLAVWDQSQTKESRELIQVFTRQNDFHLFSYTHSYNEIDYLLDKGDIHTALIIPKDFSKNIKTDTSTVQIIIDGSDPTYAKEALSRSQNLLLNYSTSIQTKMLERNAINEKSLPIKSETNILYNPTMESLNYNIPALIGLVMQEVILILTAFAIVREKEHGTMAQLIVTPIRPLELILGKLVPYIFIGLLSFAFVLIVGIWWFNVSIAGSIYLLIGLSILFLIASLAIGLFISVIANNQLQAMYMAFAVILPSVILSGFVFPRETMPTFIQMLGGLIPLTYFLEILRGIFLKGVSLDILWLQSIVLLTFIVITCIATASRFKKQL